MRDSDDRVADDDEVEIIKRVLAGEREEFRHLVRTHQGTVYGMIMRQVGDSSIANELSQDTFLRAYRGLAGFRFNSRFSTWLTRIAINVTNSYFVSRRYKEQKRTKPLDQVAVRALEEAAGDNSGYSEAEIKRLRSCVGGLKALYRDVVVLCCLEGKTYEEAASILEIAPGTVGSRLNKAFELLRASFFQEESHE